MLPFLVEPNLAPKFVSHSIKKGRKKRLMRRYCLIQQLDLPPLAQYGLQTVSAGSERNR